MIFALPPVVGTFASETGFYNEEGYVKYYRDRPAINPEFAPDRSCLFDVFQDKCVPGTDQECPKDFGINDAGTCFPYVFITEGCPDGYHSMDDDETGQCYPNSEECPKYMKMNDEKDNCEMTYD